MGIQFNERLLLVLFSMATAGLRTAISPGQLCYTTLSDATGQTRTLPENGAKNHYVFYLSQQAAKKSRTAFHFYNSEQRHEFTKSEVIYTPSHSTHNFDRSRRS